MGDFLGSYFADDEELSSGNEVKLIVPMEQPVSVVDMEDVEVLQRNRETRSRLQELDLLQAKQGQQCMYKMETDDRDAQSPEPSKTKLLKICVTNFNARKIENCRDERETDNNRRGAEVNKTMACCSNVEEDAVEISPRPVSLMEEEYDALSTVSLTKMKSTEKMNQKEMIIVDKKENFETNVSRKHDEQHYVPSNWDSAILNHSDNSIMLNCSNQDHASSLQTNPKTRVGKVAKKFITAAFRKNALGKLFQRRVSQ